MIVRDATAADLPRILAMAEAFCAVAGRRFEAAAAEANISAVRERGFLLVARGTEELVGMLAAIPGPDLCSSDVIYHEVCLWVEPDRRGTTALLHLLREFDRRAYESGAVGAQLSALATSPEGLTNVYQRLGYRPSDSSFYKSFGGH